MRPAAGRRRLCLSLPLFAATGVFLLSVSCSAPPKVPFTHMLHWRGDLVPGYLYHVREGDTLASIADHFEVDLDLLAVMNNKRPDRALGANSRVFIPRVRGGFPASYYAKPRYSDTARSTEENNGSRMEPGGGYRMTYPPARRTPRPPTVMLTPTPAARAAPRTSQAAPPRWTPAESRKKGIQFAKNYRKEYNARSPQRRVPNAPPFQWPAQGVLTSRFNVRSRGERLHLGIDIANKAGTPIRAALGGRVLYSDSKHLASMGNMVLIEHAGGWVTVYSHNKRNIVKEGESVRAGQVIAYMGETGRATGPHLHFEIRRNADTPVDPLLYLPSRR